MAKQHPFSAAAARSVAAEEATLSKIGPIATIRLEPRPPCLGVFHRPSGRHLMVEIGPQESLEDAHERLRQLVQSQS